MRKPRPRKDPKEKHAAQHGAAGEPCLFCKIVSREVEAKIIFEDEISIAFLDVRPLFPGHVLLIPKAHYPTLSDLPAALIGPFFTNAQMLARKVQSAMKADGTFVAINNIVSQSVPHLHVHIVPRKRQDGLRGFFWPRRPCQEGEMLALHEVLSKPS
jgi:histidine triad (HIT) family protein